MGSKWYAGFEYTMKLNEFSDDFDHWCWFETLRFFFFFFVPHLPSECNVCFPTVPADVT